MADQKPQNNKDTFRSRSSEIEKLRKELYSFKFFYNQIISRINKLEDDTRAAIEFADLAEDDKGTELIIKFCNDITDLIGE